MSLRPKDPREVINFKIQGEVRKSNTAVPCVFWIKSDQREVIKTKHQKREVINNGYIKFLPTDLFGIKLFETVIQ